MWTVKRLNIREAKRKLYAEILQLDPGEWTADDRRIGMALVLDSEIQRLLDEVLKPKAKEILYSGQCDHHIPFGQPCQKCGR